jgi:hypothetical protein
MKTSRERALVSLTLGVWLAACGGKGVSAPDSTASGSTSGAGSSSPSAGSFAESPGTAGSAPVPAPNPGAAGSGPGPATPAGQCTAVCLSWARFSVSGIREAEVFSGQFEACRNLECYRGGPFDPSSQGNSIHLVGSFSWDETAVALSYQRTPSLSLDFEWRPPINGKRLSDGDRYTLKSLNDSGTASTLIDTVVSYEQRSLCGQECQQVYVPDLVRPPPVDEGQAGAGGADGAGGAASAAGASSD